MANENTAAQAPQFDELVTAYAPRAFRITVGPLDGILPVDGEITEATAEGPRLRHGHSIEIAAGVQRVRKSVLNHWWAQRNGLTEFTGEPISTDAPPTSGKTPARAAAAPAPAAPPFAPQVLKPAAPAAAPAQADPVAAAEADADAAAKVAATK